MKIKSELRELQSHIEEVLYFCEVTKKSKFQTIEVLEMLFDHYRANKVDKFFEDDYYEKYTERLDAIRQCNSGGNIYSIDETLFI